MPSVRRPLVAVALAATLSASLLDASPAEANGFDPRIVTFGDARDEIKNKPMTERPNRPLHIYGNSVRRRAQRTPSGTRRM